jgi:glycosyltransferase involved in cell wall biosynthesis
VSAPAIVVPAYNEERSLPSVVRDLLAHAPVIVVDDASTDATASVAEEAGAIVIRLTENGGYGAAVDAGFREADARGYDGVVTADADGQHDPDDVARFVDLIAGPDVDLVVGIRDDRRRFVERLCSLYARRAFGIEDPLCGLKAYDLRFYREYGGFDLQHSVGVELMAHALRNGARWKQLPVSLRTRSHGSSRFYVSARTNLRILRSLRALVVVR